MVSTGDYLGVFPGDIPHLVSSDYLGVFPGDIPPFSMCQYELGKTWS